MQTNLFPTMYRHERICKFIGAEFHC